jgi:riboflavin synthase
MFSGIVETTASITSSHREGELVRIHIERPKSFEDIAVGDSIAVNGVCLTVEEFDPRSMRFALGQETLRITGWSPAGVQGKVMNLERSLRLQDRIHGHLVTGHVDTLGTVMRADGTPQELKLTIGFAHEFAPFIWAKGSITIAGVSLTINQVEGDTFKVGLIPETLKRTNLGDLKTGDQVNLEMDNMARGLVNWARLQQDKK